MNEDRTIPAVSLTYIYLSDKLQKLIINIGLRLVIQ